MQYAEKEMEETVLLWGGGIVLLCRGRQDNPGVQSAFYPWEDMPVLLVCFYRCKSNIVENRLTSKVAKLV